MPATAVFTLNIESAQLHIMDECQITGTIVSSRVCIKDSEAARGLAIKGFGDGDTGGGDERLFLEPFEALYLLHTGHLILNKGRRELSFGSFLSICKKTDPDILTRFLIYRDLRTRGYVAKDGFGFGADFRVYERGQFGQKGAKFLIFGLVEGQPERMGQLQKKIREITQMGKEPIMAVVDRHGEIIYYRIGIMEVHDNRRREQAHDGGMDIFDCPP